MTTQRDTLARAMFDRQATSYDADPALAELAWVDPEIRAFWEAEADHVLEILGLTPCGGCEGKGSHRRHCRRNPAYSLTRELADRAEDVGDSIGSNDPAAANHCYAAAGMLRTEGGRQAELAQSRRAALSGRITEALLRNGMSRPDACETAAVLLPLLAQGVTEP